MEVETKNLIVSILQTLLALMMSLFYSFVNSVSYFLPASWRRYNVTDKVTLITGSGSGLGRAVALRMAQKGSRVVLWDSNQAANLETAKMIRDEGGKCYACTVDLRCREDIYRAAQRTKEDVGKVDILINNAGIVNGHHLLETPDELIVKTFEVNILSHFWTVKAFLPDMMESNSGQIITVASLAGIFGVNKLVDYCSSKFAAVGFDEALRVELSACGYRGIRTTVVCPYYVNTGMFDGVESSSIPVLDPEFAADEITDGILMKKKMVIIPSSCNLMVSLKGMMSPKGYEFAAMSLGMTHAMDNFVGRKKVKAY